MGCIKNRKFWSLGIISAFIFVAFTACGKKEIPPSELINSQDSFVAVTEQILDIPAIGEHFRIMQGGCVNEQYAWFILVSAENYSDDRNKLAYVLKYDLETMEEICRSEEIKLGHANDMTYIPDTNEIYVDQGYLKRFTVLDADTLELKEVKKLKFDHYAMDYVPSRESFVTASGICGMFMYDKNLKVSDATYSLETTLVTQGICADDKYVYHVLWSKEGNTEEPENMIFVVDWEGNLISRIPIGMKGQEPENISLVGDTFYIGCNTGEGGVVYTAKIKKNEE